MQTKDTIVDTIEDIKSTVKRLEADIQNLLNDIQVFEPVGGNSPMIITDGSLNITSIQETITAPAAGTGPYTYTVTKNKPLKRFRCCDGLVPLGANPWRLEISDSAKGTITIAAGTGGIQISNVPAGPDGNPIPVNNNNVPESVLAIASFNISSAVFYPGDGSKHAVGQSLMMLHFN